MSLRLKKQINNMLIGISISSGVSGTIALSLYKGIDGLLIGIPLILSSIGLSFYVLKINKKDYNQISQQEDNLFNSESNLILIQTDENV